MRAAKVGVVDDIDVVGLRGRGSARRNHLDQGTGGILHGADKDRQAARALRDQRAILGGIDPVGAVVRLCDHGREGRAGEAEVHLVANLLQARLNDRKGDGVDTAHSAAPIWIIRLPSTPPWTRSPGGIRVVQSSCSMMAGPSRVTSAGR
jgi:hypothetical protein